MKNDNPDRRDDLLRHIAELYVREDGKRLQAQWAEAEHASPPPAPGFQERVWAQIRGLELAGARARRRRNIGRAAALAACLLLVFAILRLADFPKTSLSSEGAAPDPMAAQQEAAEAPEALPSTQGIEEYTEEEAVYDAGAIPLSFAVPPEFAVAEVETDGGKTIYHLSNTLQDDVVLTLESWEDGARLETEGLYPVAINGYDAWGRSRSDYSIITFQKDGLIYHLSCRYDSRTLMGLSRTIL